MGRSRPGCDLLRGVRVRRGVGSAAVAAERRPAHAGLPRRRVWPRVHPGSVLHLLKTARGQNEPHRDWRLTQGDAARSRLRPGELVITLAEVGANR